jgi:hypothetical protein
MSASETELRKVRYSDLPDGTEPVGEKSGYHQPRQSGCGCTRTTEKGAYRDETYEVDGLTVHFYHQSPVVVTDGERYRLDSCGHETATTKERINRYLPAGYRVVQDDWEWYLESWDPKADYRDQEREREPFADGMVIEP